MKLVNRISELAGKKRLKTADLSKEAKVSWQTVDRLWRGETKRIEFNTMVQLCRVLECQPGDLFQVDLCNGDN